MGNEQLRIRITKIPDGPAPDEVRSSWVGLELPANELPIETQEFDFITRQQVQNRGGYMVPAYEALEVLEQSSEVSAAWFRLALPTNISFLTFRRDEAIIVYQTKAK